VKQWSLSGLPIEHPGGEALFGTFVDLEGNVWFTDQWRWSTLNRFYGYLYRLGTNNIITYWQFTPLSTISYGVTVDTKANVGNVYVSGYVYGSEYTSAGYAILRFRH
jgi:streptogramin lyase